jgi:KUP system potassium uptake protein
MVRWRKRLFIALAHNAADPAQRFHLPDERTIVVGAHLEL